MGSRGLQGRTALLCAGVAVSTVVALVLVGMWRSSTFSAAADVEVNRLVDEQLDETTRGLVRLVQAQADTVQQQVDANLEVARHLALNAGGFEANPSEVLAWTATNQFSSEQVAVELPEMSVGGRAFGQDPSLERPMPLVDTVRNLVDGTVTVFQRMNDDGDMLRIATNVVTTDEQRAIGTFIPAVNPDGTPNPVVSTVLGGETYRGNAFVVNAWQATAYEPITTDGEVTGMLFVGVPQVNVASLRDAVADVRIGERGGAEVLAATGDARGEVRLSATAESGVSRLDELDADGSAYLADLVDGAVDADGEVVAARHVVDGTDTVLRASYFAPWDWVVVTRVPVEDVSTAATTLAEGRRDMILGLVVAGVVALVLALLVGRQGARTIARKVRSSATQLQAAGAGLQDLGGTLTSASATTADNAQAVSAAGEQVNGNVATVVSAVEELEASVREISQHTSEASNVAAAAVDSAQETLGRMDRLSEASTEIGGVVELITSIAEQTNLLALNATIEAARAGDAGKGFAVVAGEVKDLASQTQQATAQVTDRIVGIQAHSSEALTAIASIVEVIERISGLQTTIAAAVEEQSAATNEIARSLTEAAGGVDDISTRIVGVAAAADQSRAAALDTRRAADELTVLADQLQAVVDGGRGAAPPTAPADDLHDGRDVGAPRSLEPV